LFSIRPLYGPAAQCPQRVDSGGSGGSPATAARGGEPTFRLLRSLHNVGIMKETYVLKALGFSFA